MNRLLTGMVLGMAAGLILTETSPEVKKMVQEGKQKLKKLPSNKGAIKSHLLLVVTTVRSNTTALCAAVTADR